MNKPTKWIGGSAVAIALSCALALPAQAATLAPPSAAEPAHASGSATVPTPAALLDVTRDADQRDGDTADAGDVTPTPEGTPEARTPDGNMESAAKHKAEHAAWHSAREAARATHKAEHSAERAKHKAEHAAHKAEHAAENKSENKSERATSKAAHKAEHETARASHKAEHQAAHAKREAARTAHKAEHAAAHAKQETARAAVRTKRAADHAVKRAAERASAEAQQGPRQDATVRTVAKVSSERHGVTVSAVAHDGKPAEIHHPVALRGGGEKKMRHVNRAATHRSEHTSGNR